MIKQIGTRSSTINVLGDEVEVSETLWEDWKGFFYTMDSADMETVTVRVIGNASVDRLWGQMQRQLVCNRLGMDYHK